MPRKKKPNYETRNRVEINIKRDNETRGFVNQTVMFLKSHDFI
jgi:hypothetical protein